MTEISVGTRKRCYQMDRVNAAAGEESIDGRIDIGVIMNNNKSGCR